MLRIAVTGGIACGKSVVGSYLSGEGIPVCDADDVAHKVMSSGSAVFMDVVERFGQGILDDAGEINRRKLADIVFSDAGQLNALNAIVHHAARKAWQEWLEDEDAKGSRVAVVIVPLLYEAGMQDGWDAVVCVGSSESVQVKRLLERGLTEPEARKRIASQMTLAEKIKRADYVIVNDDGMDLLIDQIKKTVRNILKKEEENE